MKFIKLNVDVPSQKIELKRGAEWPWDSAPSLVRHFAGDNEGNVMHKLGSVQICTVFSRDVDDDKSDLPAEVTDAETLLGGGIPDIPQGSEGLNLPDEDNDALSDI